MKIKSIELDNYKVLQNFKIDFTNNNDEILNLIVIAGINGTGKTTILESICDIFDADKFQNNYKFIVNDKSNRDIIIDDKKIYQGLAGKSIKDEIESKIYYFKVFDNQKENVIGQIKNFIDMIKDNNEDLTIKGANQKATDEINSIFEGLDLQTKFKGLSKDINRDILFQNDIKDDIKLDDLSTGEQQLFIRALSLKMMQLENSIILIDEPEISLHPNWQNNILKIYSNIANDGNNQLIVATHSPQIVASTPNQSLRVLVKKNTKIEVKSYDNSYGASIEEVLEDFMDTKYLRTPKIAKKIKKMWGYINNQDLENFEKLYGELNNILDTNDNELVLVRLKKARLLAQK